MNLVSMKGISKSFFGVYANKNVDLEINSGEIVALLGENGAGKTTLMNILYGIYQKDDGILKIKDDDVCFKSPKDALKYNIGMVHQHFTLVPSLTVEQNITLGENFKGYPFLKTKDREAEIAKLSKEFNFAINPSELVKDLSIGQQQRVEILKLLYRKAQILILDEPTAVLTPQETESFFEVLKKLAKQNCAIILITHRISEVLKIADRVVVLRDGVKELDDKTKNLNKNTLSKAMIGRELKKQQIKYVPRKEVGLSLKNLSSIGIGRNISYFNFDVFKGEILGVAGVDGNGQKALAESIVGIRKYSNGKIFIDGEDITNLSTAKRKESKVAYISDDRHHDGLLLNYSVEENLLLKGDASKKYYKKGVLSKNILSQDATSKIDEYKIKTYSSKTPIRLLSGGNQQKLILAREISEETSVVVAFQPTRGLDVGASESVHDKLYQKQKEGASIVLISTDMDELRKMSNRILVIHDGMIMGIVDNDQNLDITKVGLMMAGSGVKNG
ncbi:MAG: ABC transporter ATP-binding protein [Sphaerochaetaceae bacterium]|nr:ABC transporter ATP-binding protein [Sphaerochaetaceae bacterium]